MPTSREQQAAISKQHYERNRAARIEAAQVSRRAQAERNAEYVALYLTTHRCVDCGTSNDLEFDHRDPSTKRAAVSDLASKGYALSTVIAEIRKCDVRCRQHHLQRHHG